MKNGKKGLLLQSFFIIFFAIVFSSTEVFFPFYSLTAILSADVAKNAQKIRIGNFLRDAAAKTIGDQAK